MNRHLTEREILDLLAHGVKPEGEVREHLEACPECRTRLEAEEPLAARLDALPGELDPPRDLWPLVTSRIEDEGSRPRNGRFGWTRPALRAAAAIAIFVLGAAVGRTLGPASPDDGRYAVEDPLAAAAEVQRAGTDYVAAVARFRAVAGTSSPVADQARDVALAAVHGAAWELSRLRPGDATAREILALARASRPAAEDP